MKAFFRAWGPVLLCLVVIAANSSRLASLERMRQLAQEISQALYIRAESSGESSFVESALLALRKPAHLVEYAVLGFLAHRALTAYRPRRHGTAVGGALGLALLAAALDELHQHTMPERTGTPRDVVIDAAGAGLGLALAWIRRSPAARG